MLRHPFLRVRGNGPKQPLAHKGELFGQDEFAQLGGLQAVSSTVVHDGDGFLALQERGAVNNVTRRTTSLAGSAAEVRGQDGVGGSMGYRVGCGDKHGSHSS